MRDGYGRAIDYMRISITDRCNLRCRYCMPEDIPLVPMKDILTYEEIELICRAAAQAGIRKLKVTGGEPLARLGCAELVGRLKRIPGIEQVTLTTNGVLLAENLSKLAESGLDAVNISLDTWKEDVYQAITGRDELGRVLEGIDRALEAGIPVKLNCVPQRGVNDGEWREFAELTRKKPVDVRFIEMMPIGYGKDYEPVRNEDILNQLKETYPGLEQDSSFHGNGPAVYWRLPDGLGSIGFISAMHGKFCESCNRIRLTSQGQLKLCLCYEDGVDLRAILRGTNSSEERLREAIVQAVGRKPQAHRFEEKNKVTEMKKMVQIGG